MARRSTEAATYKKMMVRLPADIVMALQSRAVQEERSLNGQLVHTLRASLGLEPAGQSRSKPPAVAEAS